MSTKLPLILLTFAGLALSGCASAPQTTFATPKRNFNNPVEQTKAQSQFAEYDPVEPVNKEVYAFNAGLDEYIFLPVVDAYKFVTPDFFRRGVANFFRNVGEITNFTNAVLQANADNATTTFGRFAINTTVGLLGTFDVATGWGLERKPEDFGKTLGHWGVDSGAYIVLPVLGPSNVRDTIGQIVDYATMYFIIPSSIQDTVAYDAVAYGLQPVNQRYVNDFRYYSTGSPFEYELVRYIVTETRNQEIANEKK